MAEITTTKGAVQVKFGDIWVPIERANTPTQKIVLIKTLEEMRKDFELKNPIKGTPFLNAAYVEMLKAIDRHLKK